MTNVLERNLNMSGIGWKVFREYDGKYVMGEYHDGLIELGKWVSKVVYPPDLERMEDAEGRYECGFHIFETEQAVKRWNKYSSPYNNKVILKVKFRHGHTRGGFTGWDVPMPCIVADEILVLKGV